LDIGCGNGSSTLEFSRRVKSALGVDFIQEYVAKAKANADKMGKVNAQFVCGNVLDLSEVRNTFGLADIAITIRCLINLPTWDDQRKGLKEISDCLPPGGLYLTSEGWLEGMTGLNIRRGRMGLQPIKPVNYNLLISRIDFENEASKYFEILDYTNLGFYIYMSRVFNPVFVSPQLPCHTHEINKIAEKIQSKDIFDSVFSDCDFAGVYVLRKKFN
jgi:SAM-dependent methyltransferase